MIRPLLVLAVITVVLLVIDRLLLAAERRGWIYYRKKKPSPGARAAAGLEIQQLLEPQRRHVIEARHAGEREENDETGDDAGRRE